MSTNENGHADLAPTVKLTPKLEKIARLVALKGLSLSDAYRAAYDVGADTGFATINENAHKLSQHNGVALRVRELTEEVQAQSPESRQQILDELQAIIDAPMQQPVRASDKIAALDKLAKIHGLYRDDSKDKDHRPINITHVEIRMPGGKVETREIEPPQGDGYQRR